MPTALNEMSTRPAFSTTDWRCVLIGPLVEGIHLCGQVGPRGKYVGPLSREGAGDGAADRASGAVDHCNLVLEHHDGVDAAASGKWAPVSAQFAGRPASVREWS